jgi:hypothetical protein
MIPLVKPIGIGDLKVVKQKLARFEAGEIAHIENVMAKESRSRMHRRLNRIEESESLEEERMEEGLRDLQSTERFEMQNESQHTIRSQLSSQNGVNITAGWGPVSISAYGKFDSSITREESDKNSTKFAKEVTDKSVARIVEKVHRERTTKTLEEFEERNKHGFKNDEGTHFSGIYRWVDKYYRAKVVNYGKRLMYEFIVPEPAAFYVFATQLNLSSKVLPTKPIPPMRPGSTDPLSPEHIDRSNYMSLVRQYNAPDVNPPPVEWIKVQKAFNREIPNNAVYSFSSDDLKVPNGYTAEYGGYSYFFQIGSGGSYVGRLHVGGNEIRVNYFPPLWFGGSQGTIAVSGIGLNISAFIFNVGLFCKLTEEQYGKWKLQTYTAIMNAYQKALMDYEEKVSAAQISQGVQIGGANPEINRAIEKTELKRSCLTMWTGRAIDYPAGITHSPASPIPDNYPEINVDNALANSPEIEFFEKAFDWKNMTYECLPYFYGRKPNWVDFVSLKDKDPIFESFLQAGAARVLVPVNLSYTEAVLYYQLTGTIWPGGEVPPFDEASNSDAQLFNSYINELKDVVDIPDIDRDIQIDSSDESTWLIKVPTNLVWLQSDSTLPNFEV